MATGPYVWIDPARRSGEPCISGTRTPVEHVVECVWDGGVDLAAHAYQLSRAQVLVACWYAGAYGVTVLHGRQTNAGRADYRPHYRERFREPWRARWRDWAESVAIPLWRVSEIDYDAIPDPPSKEPA